MILSRLYHTACTLSIFLLAGCPAPGVIVPEDRIQSTNACVRSLEYGYAEFISADSLNSLLSSPEIGNKITMYDIHNNIIESDSLFYSTNMIEYHRFGEQLFAHTDSIKKIVVPIRVYNKSEILSIIINGRYEDQDIVLNC